MAPLEWWNDTPAEGDPARLVVADELTARGDPRGEFIVAQCTQPGSPRIGQLWQQHHVAWLSALGFPPVGWFVKSPGLSSAMRRGSGGFELFSAQFERGFLTRLWAPFLENGCAAVLREHASLRHLELDAVPPEELIALLTEHPFSLEGLGVSGAFSEASLSALSELPVFLQLGEFSLSAGAPPDVADERALFIIRAAAQAPRLTRLRLEGALSHRPLKVLKAQSWTVRLTHLDLTTQDASEEAPALLEHLVGLQSLAMVVHRATPRLAEALLGHRLLRGVRIRTSAPVELPVELTERLETRFGKDALVRV